MVLVDASKVLASSKVLCLERKRLLYEYRDATKLYFDTVDTLLEMVCGALESDVDLLRRNCREARERADQARLTLYRHEINHCCDRTDWADSIASVPRNSGRQ